MVAELAAAARGAHPAAFDAEPSTRHKAGDIAANIAARRHYGIPRRAVLKQAVRDIALGESPAQLVALITADW